MFKDLPNATFNINALTNMLNNLLSSKEEIIRIRIEEYLGMMKTALKKNHYFTTGYSLNLEIDYCTNAYEKSIYIFKHSFCFDVLSEENNIYFLDNKEIYSIPGGFIPEKPVCFLMYDLVNKVGLNNLSFISNIWINIHLVDENLTMLYGTR
jgi:hypothetical protein